MFLLLLTISNSTKGKMASEEIIIKAALDGHKKTVPLIGGPRNGSNVSQNVVSRPWRPLGQELLPGAFRGGVSCTTKCSSTLHFERNDRIGCVMFQTAFLNRHDHLLPTLLTNS